jgi:hypothetical protein
VHPDGSETTTPDEENPPEASTASTGLEVAVEPNPAAELKSTDSILASTDPEPATDRISAGSQRTAEAQPAAGPQTSAQANFPEPELPSESRPAPAGVTSDVGSAPAASVGRGPIPAEDADAAEGSDAMLSAGARQELSTRWSDIQATFVDRPQGSVQEADALVVDVMQRVTWSLSNERERLESQWRQGDDVSTEDLRVALTRYRTFFDRLLST